MPLYAININQCNKAYHRVCFFLLFLPLVFLFLAFCVSLLCCLLVSLFFNLLFSSFPFSHMFGGMVANTCANFCCTKDLDPAMPLFFPCILMIIKKVERCLPLQLKWEAQLACEKGGEVDSLNATGAEERKRKGACTSCLSQLIVKALSIVPWEKETGRKWRIERQTRIYLPY